MIYNNGFLYNDHNSMNGIPVTDSISNDTSVLKIVPSETVV